MQMMILHSAFVFLDTVDDHLLLLSEIVDIQRYGDKFLSQIELPNILFSS